MELFASHARLSSRSVSAFLVVAAALTSAPLTSCSGHGDGGTGDLPSDPAADNGDAKRVDELVHEADWYDPSNQSSLDCGSPDPKRAHVTELTVVAIDTFDEVNDNRIGNIYAVQTPGKKGLQPYDSITLRTPSFTPPDLRLFPGDVIDTFGNFVEFLGPPSASLFGACKTLPQIEGTATFSFEGSDITPYLLVPSEAEAAAAGNTDRWAALKSYEAARPFIGMLVTLHEVELTIKTISSAGALTDPINVGGGISVQDQPALSNELYDIAHTSPPLPDGARFASVTGIVTYFYGFKIAPRSPADFVRDAAPDTSASSGGAFDD